MENQTVFIKKTVDDFHRVGELNTKRIKAYNDIAKEYNTPISVIRDIFSLGINFAISNLEEIELPNDDELNEKSDLEKGSSMWFHSQGFTQGANFILNKLKGDSK